MRTTKTQQKNTYSYSKIIDFLNCPRKYKHIYLEGGQGAVPNANLEYGRKIHEKAELLCKAKDPDEVKKILADMPDEFERGLAYAEYFADKKVVLAETPIYIKIGKYKIEMHIDNAHITQDGTLRILDIKTGKIYIDEEILEKNIQLLIYTWGVLKWIQEQNIPVFNIEYGIWFWQKHYHKFIEIDYANTDAIEQFILNTIKSIEKEKEFKPKENEYCYSCPLFKSCYPETIPDTLQEIRNKVKFWTEKLEKKREELLNEFLTNKIDKKYSEKDMGYYLLVEKERNEYDIDKFLEKVNNDIDIIKNFISITKTKLKEYNVELEPAITKTQLEIKFEKTIKGKENNDEQK